MPYIVQLGMSLGHLQAGGSPAPGSYGDYISAHVLIGRERETINASQYWPNCHYSTLYTH